MDDPFAIELQEHATALRALARLLVGEAHADDLVQDVALQTLRQPPPVQTGMRAFLRTMLRRRASNLRRTERRRRRREKAVAQTTVEMSPASLVEHQEVVRLVTDQLLALPAPYRDTVFRRFFHDATPSEIAATTGVPVATVKSQLQRGLAMLRERLDRERGSTWRPLLAAATGVDLDRLVPGPAGAGGVVAMGLATKTLLGLGIAALALLAWIPAAEGEPPRDATPSEGLGGAAIAATATRTPTSPASAADAERRAAVPIERTSGAAARFLGRVVDETGRPLAEAAVDIKPTADPQDLYRFWRRHGEFELSPQRTKTRADGTFTFDVLTAAPVRFEFAVGSPDHLPIDGGDYEIAAGAEKHLDDFVLRRGTRVHGKVVDRSGRPQAGCEILIDCQDSLGDVLPQCWDRSRTSVDGAVEFDALLPAGTYHIEVQGRRNPTPSTVVLTLGARVADFMCVVDDVVTPMTITGRVVDERGVPLRDATVSVPQSTATAHADADGRFVLARPEQCPDVVSLRAGCPGFENQDGARAFPWGTTDVGFELRRGVEVDLLVVAADTGQPVEDFVLSWDRVVPAAGQPTVGARHGHFPGGRIHFEGIPRGDWELLVICRDPRLEPLQQVVACSGPATTATLELRPLVEPHACDTEALVRVQTADGTVMPNSTVTVAELLARNYPVQWSEPIVLRSATTDRAGEVRLRAPAGMPVRWTVTGADHLSWTRDDAGLPADGVVTAVVARGGTFHGRVTPADFAARYRRGPTPWRGPRALPQVHFVALDGSAAADLNGHRVPIADDGTFRSPRLAAARWRIELEWIGDDDEGSSSEQGPELGVVQLEDGATAPLAFDLARLAACELDAGLTWNGEPLRRAEVDLVFLEPNGGEVSHAMRTDADGRLIGVSRPGRFCIDWWHIDPNFLVRSDQTVEVAPGERVTTTFTLRTGRARLQLRRPDGSPARGVLTYLWDPQSPTPLDTHNPTDEHGAVEWTLPPGDYQVQLDALGSRGRTIGRVVVAAGEVANAELRVGADDR